MFPITFELSTFTTCHQYENQNRNFIHFSDYIQIENLPNDNINANTDIKHLDYIQPVDNPWL